MKKKIAIVNQRYGVEVNGGSELHTRLVAERLNSRYDVEVLTTCALDYLTWENHYSEGLCKVNDVNVRRFKVERFRDMEQFNKINTRLLETECGNPDTEEEWVDAQGPYCPKLIDFIEDNADNYDVFIFVTYLYYLTARGIGLVSDKTVLIPTAHDEPMIYFNIYRDVFTCPCAIAFNTEEERSLIHRQFRNQNIPGDIVGVGIDIPEHADPDKFCNTHGLDNYLLYVGRIDEGKNCQELFDFFVEYKRRNPSSLKLVLMGKEIISVPTHPDIISLGFVSDETKNNGMAGAKLLVLPSMFESLSMSVLESMALGVPVLVNGKCDVLKGHCLKSNAGLYYSGYLEFEGCINYLFDRDKTYKEMSRNAQEYVRKNYQWDIIIEKFVNLIEYVGGGRHNEFLISSFVQFDEFIDKYEKRDYMETEISFLRKYRIDFDSFVGLFGQLPPNSDPFSNEYAKWELDFFEFLSGGEYSFESEGLDEDQGIRELAELPPTGYMDLEKRIHDMRFYAGFLEAVKPRKGSHTLEMGFGLGNLLELLGRHGCVVSGIDASRAQAIYVKERLAAQNINTGELICGSFYDVDKISGKYDLIVFEGSFHHCGEPVKLLTMLHDVLAADGKIVFFKEPIDSFSDRPWGVVRYDGESMLQIRQKGWLELGYRTDFFKELLDKTGFKCNTHPMSDGTTLYEAVLK